MNLEEARNNIGADVELDESTKPYTDSDGVYESRGYVEQELSRGEFRLSGFNRNDVVISKELGSETVDFLVNPRHLKLKPQNYKIHVPTEKESKEAQELFFELWYGWVDSGKTVGLTECPYLYAFSSGYLGFDRQIGANHFKCHPNKQITLQELRDMVAKKKQTQPIQESVKPIVDGLETSVAIQDFDSSSGEDKTVQVTGTFQNFEPRKEMTWEDALRAVADGKEVEVKNISWFNIKDLKLENVKRGTAFRVVPKRITLNGEYTKEELLQKIGEME